MKQFKYLKALCGNSITFPIILQGIGNGLPLGAVVTTPEIASVLAQKIQFNTFGGNPVCSAGGLAVLKVLDKEKRQAHCHDIGSHLLERLRTLQQKHESNNSFNLSFQKNSVIILFFQKRISYTDLNLQPKLHCAYLVEQ